jgi:thiamine-monophosphate kinase
MPSSEFTLIARYFSALGRGKGVELSVGDDCAILSLAADERLATSTDTLLAGVHFPEDAFPEDLAWRAVSVTTSDLAAMGAEPRGMTLAIALPEADEYWLAAFSEGLAQASSAYGIPLVGGDTVRGPLSMTITVLGALPQDRALLRSGAAVGDQVLVSGTPGDAAAGLAFLREQWQPQAAHAEYLYQRYYRPTPRLALGQALLGVATAAIDISDGLLADAGHIADASGVGMLLDPGRLPLSPALRSHPDGDQALRWALAGGDDYELCFTLPDGVAAPGDCTVIGTVVTGTGVDCGLDIDSPPGYRHF